jgi:hypothetical protein
MPEVSVIVPTNRVGGLDLLLSGLAGQTFKDFELVLVDNLLPNRGSVVAEMAARHGVAVKHLAPLGGSVSQGQYQRSLNTGLVRADGRITVILCDYTWLRQDCLAEHVAFQDRHPGESCIGTVKYTRLPVLASDFPRKYGWYVIGYDPENQDPEKYKPWLNDTVRLALLETWCRDYESDLAAGVLDKFLWSTFSDPVTPGAGVELLDVYHHEKADMPEGLLPHVYCNLKNNSFLTEQLLSINGFDEDMDGCHVHQDSEMAGRLQARLGTAFRLVHRNVAHFFDPHGIAIIRKMVRDESANLEVYNKAFRSGFSNLVNSWSLLEKRKELGAT